jgi:Zn-dependent peptidase ImmA (M78 family)/DNA-binding XRE family transcriptional regulator
MNRTKVLIEPIRSMNGERVLQAREIRRLTQAELALKIGVSQPIIARIEQSLLFASDELLEKIALQTGFPLDFFTKEAPVPFPIGSLLYRKYSSLRSQDKAWLRQVAEIAYEIHSKLSQRVRRIPVSFPKLDDEDVVSVARLLRNALGYPPETPIRNLIYRLEVSGVICLALPAQELEGFDGFSMWVERRPVLVLNSDRPVDRIKWTAAHEIIHLVLHHSLQGSVAAAEREASQAGSEFLMPTEAMLREIIAPVTLSNLAELKQRWGVSIQALVRRAYNLRIIAEHQYKYLNIKIREFGWKKEEPGSAGLGIEKPRVLRKLAEMFYGNDFRRLADEMSFPRTLVEEIVGAHATAGELPRKGPDEPGPGGSVIRFVRK